MTPADEFLRPFDIARDRDLPLGESDLTTSDRDKISLRPVDILFDLGLTEDMVTAYFLRWRWGWVHNQAVGLLRTPRTAARREGPFASSIILP